MDIATVNEIHLLLDWLITQPSDVRAKYLLQCRISNNPAILQTFLERDCTNRATFMPLRDFGDKLKTRWVAQYMIDNADIKATWGDLKLTRCEEAIPVYLAGLHTEGIGPRVECTDLLLSFGTPETTRDMLNQLEDTERVSEFITMMDPENWWWGRYTEQEVQSFLLNSKIDEVMHEHLYVTKNIVLQQRIINFIMYLNRPSTVQALMNNRTRLTPVIQDYIALKHRGYQELRQIQQQLPKQLVLPQN